MEEADADAAAGLYAGGDEKRCGGTGEPPACSSCGFALGPDRWLEDADEAGSGLAVLGALAPLVPNVLSWPVLPEGAVIKLEEPGNVVSSVPRLIWRMPYTSCVDVRIELAPLDAIECLG